MPKEIANKFQSTHYDNAPISEVACGFSFSQIDNLKIPHIGLFWEKVRSGFPRCEHAEPLIDSPNLPIDQATGMPLPRIWFVGESGNDLIQIQVNKFYYNWRRIKPQDEYPRHDTVLSHFRKNSEIFLAFLEELHLGPLEPLGCELTYINHIVKGEGWESVSDMGNLFPDFAWRVQDRFLAAPRSVSWLLAFDLPEDYGQLRISLKEGFRNIDKVPVLVLELSAKGLGSNQCFDAVWKWFKMAHELIVLSFRDITSEVVQQEVWKRARD